MLFNSKTKIIGAGALLLSSCVFAQLPTNGFYPKKNNLVIAPTYSYKTYDQFYMGENLNEGNPAGLEEITASILSLYAKYGITNRISASLTLPYISLTSKNGTPDPVQNTDKVNGIQDLGLYLKGLILKKDFNNSSKLSVGAATGITFPLSDYEGGGVLSLGNQATSFNGEAILHYETPFKIFTEAKLGYSVRENDDFNIPNALMYSAKLGYIHKYFYTHIQLDVQDSTSGLDIGTDEFVAAGAAAILPETEVDFKNLSFTLYVPVYKELIGISGNYAKVIDGRNVSKESGVSFGIVYNSN